MSFSILKRLLHKTGHQKKFYLLIFCFYNNVITNWKYESPAHDTFIMYSCIMYTRDFKIKSLLHKSEHQKHSYLRICCFCETLDLEINTQLMTATKHLDRVTHMYLKDSNKCEAAGAVKGIHT